MIHNFISREFFLFLVTGGTAAAVNFVSRIFYNQFFSFSYSIVLAYLTGMITAFILAKVFVFKKSQQTVANSILFFVLVNIVAGLQTWAISISLATYILPKFNMTFFPNEVAHAFGVVFPVFTSYIGHKYLSFR